MKVDLVVDCSIADVRHRFVDWTRSETDGIWCAETNETPWQTLAVCSGANPSWDLVSAVAIAFARSPMNIAYDVATLHRLHGPGLIVGLGTQIPQHIKRRFGMEWDRPITRMREYIEAFNAIWHSWRTGEPLKFRGEIYRFTLMPFFYRPNIAPTAETPPIFLAVVGPQMTKLAGSVAAGIIIHSLSTPGYLADVTVPALGLATAERSDFTIAHRPLLAMGDDNETIENGLFACRAEIAVHLATPSYRTLIEHEDLESLHQRLRALSLQGKLDEMIAAVTPDVYDRFVIRGSMLDVTDEYIDRFGAEVSRVSLQMPVIHTSRDLDRWHECVDRLRICGEK